MNVLATMFSRAATKAWAGGAASAVSTVGATMMGVCDFETLGQQLGGAAGAFVVGYLMTYVPSNR